MWTPDVNLGGLTPQFTSSPSYSVSQPPLYASCLPSRLTHPLTVSTTTHVLMLTLKSISLVRALIWISEYFQLPPRYFHHPNVPRAQHARSSAPIHQLFLLCSLVWCPCSSTFTSQVPEESLFPSHPLLRYLISSIYFVFVIILPFHSYYRFPNLGCPHLLSGLQDCMLILSSPTQSFSTVFRLIF